MIVKYKVIEYESLQDTDSKVISVKYFDSMALATEYARNRQAIIETIASFEDEK